jgi:hypothetical protein
VLLLEKKIIKRLVYKMIKEAVLLPQQYQEMVKLQQKQ